MDPREQLALAVFCFIILGVFVFDVYIIFRYIFSKFRKSSDKIKFFTPLNTFFHLSALVGIFCFIYGCYVEPYNLKTTKLEFTSSKVDKPIRIIHFSDLHCDSKVRNEKKLIELVNSLKPDLICFTGDALNSGKGEDILINTLLKMKAKYGKYVINGNFDYGFWGRESYARKTGFILLQNESVNLTKNGINVFLSGADFSFYNKLKSVTPPENTYNILLNHTPDLIEDEFVQKYNLCLAGHTHGGQVCVPGWGAIMTLSKFWKKYESGLYKVKNTFLYVTRGVGMEGGSAPRVRFWCPPEVVVIDIKPSIKDN